jgi:uncharacterized protein (TIGR00290 family)
MKQKIIFSWSGGKDSSLALWQLANDSQFQIAGLLTVLSSPYKRVSHHGVRQDLLEKQVKALGYPLKICFLEASADNQKYEELMRTVLSQYSSQGIAGVGFGDIFLEDLRKYREEKMAQVNMKGVFPLWKIDSNILARRFIDSGFKAVITSVDSALLPKEFCGRQYDGDFLKDLPKGVDPCGENGEFHSFVYAGPLFKQPVASKIGQTIERDNRYYYTDLINE